MSSFLTTAVAVAGSAKQNQHLIESAWETSQAVGTVAGWVSGSALHEIATKKLLEMCKYKDSRTQMISAQVVRSGVKLSLLLIRKQTTDKVAKKKIHEMTLVIIDSSGKQLGNHQETILGVLDSTGLSTDTSKGIIKVAGLLWSSTKEYSVKALHQQTDALYDAVFDRITTYLEGRFSEDIQRQSRSIGDSLISMVVQTSIGYTTSFCVNSLVKPWDEDNTIRSTVDSVLTLAWAVPLMVTGAKCLYDARKIRGHINKLMNDTDDEINRILVELADQSLLNKIVSNDTKAAIVSKMTQPLKRHAHQLITKHFKL